MAIVVDKGTEKQEHRHMYDRSIVPSDSLVNLTARTPYKFRKKYGAQKTLMKDQLETIKERVIALLEKKTVRECSRILGCSMNALYRFKRKHDI